MGSSDQTDLLFVSDRFWTRTKGRNNAARSPVRKKYRLRVRKITPQHCNTGDSGGYKMLDAEVSHKPELNDV